jgi:hypothetical protein
LPGQAAGAPGAAKAAATFRRGASAGAHSMLALPHHTIAALLCSILGGLNCHAPTQAKMTERNFHQVCREIRLMRQIDYEGAVKLEGTFEDSGAIYLVQEICAKVGVSTCVGVGYAVRACACVPACMCV